LISRKKEEEKEKKKHYLSFSSVFISHVNRITTLKERARFQKLEKRRRRRKRTSACCCFCIVRW